MIRINLLSVKEKKEVISLNAFTIGVLVIVAVLCVIVAIDLIETKRIKDTNNEIADVKKRINQLESVRKKVEEFKAKNKELEEKIKVISVLEENRTGPLFVMDALGQAIPNRAWVDSFSEKEYTAKIEGTAWDELTVSDFMKRLQSSPYFQNVDLKVINTKEIQQLSLKTFVIESKLNYSGKTKTEEEPQERREKKQEKRKPNQKAER
jgi:type IV pilus assembly protein PilN